MGRSDYFRYALTLAVICFVASAMLGAVYSLTHPAILSQQARQEESGLREVLPEAKNFEAVKEGENIIYYIAFGPNKRVLGYVFKASKKGYSGEIVTMVGVDKAGLISRIKILSQNETPGIGTRIIEALWFEEQFRGKNADDLSNGVQVITGATITSRAVIDSIKEKAKEVMERVHGR
ncbi:MAG: RnfABCDGE type electron transport complex subunit G [Candidatus Omnitrophota bacterium]